MKLLVVFQITILFLIVIAAIPEEEITQKWMNFLVKYQKSYKSAVQWQQRRAIFSENLEKYLIHNQQYEQGKTTYKKGINKFTDMTENEFMVYVNGSLLKEYAYEGSEAFVVENYSKIAKFIDWRKQGAVTAVRDQGLCEPSYAFSAIGAIEGQLKVTRGFIANLSVQNIVDCSGNYGNLGCGSGLMTNCFQYVKENGIESEEMYPYVGHMDTQCLFQKHRSVAKLQAFAKISTGSERALQSAITTVGPISVGMHATGSFQGYHSGIFDDESCSSDNLNHAALAVGYGTENGIDYYLVKNSFGEEWGENGYFRIIRNKNNTCGIASLASYPILD